jgi:hypothetical protein
MATLESLTGSKTLAMIPPLLLFIDCMTRLIHLMDQAEPTLSTATERSGLLTLAEPAQSFP